MKQVKRPNPLPRWVRAIGCILASVLLLLAFYVSIGCPGTFRQQFRRAEKANLVGPSKILYTLDATHQYKKMIIGETDYGISFFGATGSSVTGNKHSGKLSYTFTYREKDGDLTLTAIPQYWGSLSNQYGDSQLVYLFDTYPEAVSASLSVHVIAEYQYSINGTKVTRSINESFDATSERAREGHFVFQLVATNGPGADALYYLSESASGKYMPYQGATITATVQLWDAQGNAIVTRDMDLSY